MRISHRTINRNRHRNRKILSIFLEQCIHVIFIMIKIISWWRISHGKMSPTFTDLNNIIVTRKSWSMY